MKQDSDQTPEKIFYDWWAWLYDIPNEGKFARRNEIAMLRRLRYERVGGCARPDIVAALCLDSFRALRSKTEAAIGHMSPPLEERLFIVAAILSRVREDDTSSRYVASKLGGKEKEDRLLKEARFLRLIRADNGADLFDQSRRICALLKNKVPVYDFGKALFRWNQDSKIRRNWAERYYGLFEEPTLPTQS